MPEQTESGKLLQQVIDLATGEVHDIGEHVNVIDTCLRGDMQGDSDSRRLGLLARMTILEATCKRNHNGKGGEERAQQLREQVDTNRMEAQQVAEPDPSWRARFREGLTGRFLIISALVALALLAVIFNARHVGELCLALLSKMAGQ